jgi:hypothetical protein
VIYIGTEGINDIMDFTVIPTPFRELLEQLLQDNPETRSTGTQRTKDFGT